MEKRELKEAYLYEKLPANKVRCHLCHHRCLIHEGGTGICQVRQNRGGILYSLVYGLTIAKNIDPIEKKPLFHFFPGSKCLSVATVGCNFQCPWCQNWHISQMVRNDGEIAGEWFPPEEVVNTAKRYNVQSISFTYTEPTIFFEFAYDTAKLATQQGILNNFVSNGYMTPEAIEMIKPYLQAINVDLKAFSKEVYTNYIKAKLDGVLETIRALKNAGIWVEITTLIVPGLNDNELQLRGCAEFIASVDRAIPWHVSRYHPDYRYHSAPATPIATLQRARRIGIEAGLYYVYTGNIPGDEGEHTFCYNCGKLLIQRFGFSLLQYNIKDAHCPQCKVAIHGLGL